MKSEIRPSEGWLFIEPLEKPFAVVRTVSSGMDICLVGHVVEYDEPQPISIVGLGILAVRAENVTNWGEHANVQLGRSEK